MPQDQLSQDEFATKIKAKYPQYKNVPNNELTAKIVAKHPEYKSSLKMFNAPAKDQEGVMSKVGRGAAIGAAEGAGIKPSTTPGGVVSGTLGQVGDMVKDRWKANAPTSTLGKALDTPISHAARTALDIVPTVIDNAATSLEKGGKQAYKDIKSGDWEGAAEHIASTVTTAALLRAGRESETPSGEAKAIASVQKTAEKGVPPAFTKAATQQVVQDLLHQRGLKVKEHLQDVHDLVRKEDTERWTHLEDTIDKGKPEGAIDLSEIRSATKDSVEKAIQTPQKLAPTVEGMTKGSEVPRVGGDRLDLSNPSHKALYDRLKEAGAFPDTDMASFAKVRQLRSKLGRELRSGSSTLSGESKSVGWKLYNDYTQGMKAAAEDAGLPGHFEDANKFHKQYMDDFGDKDSLLGKAMHGENASEVMEPLSSPKTAAQAREVMKRYGKHGIDPKMIEREGQVFQKLASGLPRQMQMSRFELAADVPTLGAASLPRQAYNLAERANAIRQVKQPNPIALRSQALKAAAEKLGSKASVKEIMAEADKATPQQ